MDCTNVCAYACGEARLAQNFRIDVSRQQEINPAILFYPGAIELAHARSVLTAHSDSDWHNKISQVMRPPLCAAVAHRYIFNEIKYFASYLLL